MSRKLQSGRLDRPDDSEGCNEAHGCFLVYPFSTVQVILLYAYAGGGGGPPSDQRDEGCTAGGWTPSCDRERGGRNTDELERSLLLRGEDFGEHVSRPRIFEANFPLVLDEALRVPGAALRARSCVGFRRRWRRLDPFGRPEMCDCCNGNLWAPQGDKPLRCSTVECARAMGVDDDHMDYEGLAQAIPPVYAQYIFGQACMREVEREFGIPAITYDEMLANRSSARRKMRHWLRGAGGEPPPTRGWSLLLPTGQRLAGSCRLLRQTSR